MLMILASVIKTNFFAISIAKPSPKVNNSRYDWLLYVMLNIFPHRLNAIYTQKYNSVSLLSWFMISSEYNYHNNCYLFV